MRFGNFLKTAFLIGITAVLSVSCLKDTQYEHSYTLPGTFEQLSSDMDNDEFWGESMVNFSAPLLHGDVLFNSKTNEGKTDFTGFAVSRAVYDAENPDALLDDGFYSANAKTGSSKSSTFVVFRNAPDILTESEAEDFHHIVFMASGYGSFTQTSCMVNNTKYVADKIAEYRKNHGQIEVELSATGYSGGTETATAKIKLASNLKQVTDGADSTMSSWTKFDLSALGSVDYIDFSVSFSDPDQTLIPQMFCMDDYFPNVHIVVK